MGISLKPATPASALVNYIDKIDLVLVMTVEPGFGGQSFIPSALDKIRELDRIRKEQGLDFLIQVDGGISAANAGEVFEAGADVLVAGSAVFGAENPEQEIIKILEA